MSFLRAVSVAMLIVGTIIGAGFASGREVVTFFGTSPNIVNAAIAGISVFFCSVLFLFVGRRVQKSDAGGVSEALFGRCRPIADVFMLFNSITVLGAMLAAADSLAAELIDVRPLVSMALGLLCAGIAVRGIGGVIKANAVLVPVMIAFLCVCTISATDFRAIPQSGGISVIGIMLYVAMNMILGGSVLTTVHKLSPREIVLASGIAALVITGLLVCIMAALQSTHAATADMPMLVIALKGGRGMYFFCVPVIAASIFTTMLSAFKGVYDYISGFVDSKPIAAAMVLIAGLTVGALGFGAVVDILYPITGGIGLVYIVCNVCFIAKTKSTRMFAPSAR